MEIFLVLAVVIGLVMWSRRANSRREAIATKTSALQTWEFDDSRSGDHVCTWELHFPTMRLRHKDYYADDSERFPLFFGARRTVNGRWEVLLSEESRAEQIASVRRELASMEPGARFREDAEERLANYEKPAEWRPIPERLVPSLETAYQRYIRQA